MNRSAQAGNTTVHNFDTLAYVGTDPLPRDQEQSRRMHQPDMMISTIDPISGRDIEDLEGCPYIVDGALVMYFESEATRQAYLDTPVDHPVKLPDNPYEDGEAEG
jgi:hypothetical protein